jgi:hypothetical protein
VYEWHLFLRQDRNGLAVSTREQKAEVLLGVAQKGSTSEMEWTVLEASIGGQKSPEFHAFFAWYWAWSQEHNPRDCAVNLIHDIKKLLLNLSTIVLYLELKRTWKCYA